MGDGLPGRGGPGPARGPPSTRPRRPTRVVLLSGDLREELPDPLPPAAVRRGRRRPAAGGAVAPGHVPHPLRHGVAPLRPRRGRGPGPAHWHRRRCSGARRRRRRRPGRGPPAGRGRTTWWWWPVGRRWPRTALLVAEAAQVLARALPRRPLPARAAPGQRASAPSTWAWPPVCCPAGSPSKPAGRWFTHGLGLGARRPRPRHRRPSCRSACRRSGRGATVRALVLLGGRPAGRLPRPPAGRAGPRRRRLRGGGGHRPGSPSPSGPTWSCRPPRPTSGRVPPPTSRAGSAVWARSWSHRVRPGPTG